MNNKCVKINRKENTSLSKTELLIKAVRRMPISKQLIPVQAATGWPIPFKKEGRVYVILLYYASHPKEKGKTILYPPLAALTVDITNFAVEEYVNLRFKNPWPEGKWDEEAGIFPHETILKMTVKEYRDKRKKLMLMYDEMFHMLAKDKNFPQDWCESFGQLLRILMEPSLEPYYRAISPEFFEQFLG